MAKNTGRGSRREIVREGSQTWTPSRTWVKENSLTGRFVIAKKYGGSFKGIR